MSLSLLIKNFLCSLTQRPLSGFVFDNKTIGGAVTAPLPQEGIESIAPEYYISVAATIGNNFLNSFIGIISSSGHETATTTIIISISVCGYFISLPVLAGYSGPRLYGMSLSLSLSSKYFVPSFFMCSMYCLFNNRC